MTFSCSLASRMKNRCETNYFLAKKLGVSQSTVANWLNGQTKPRLRHIGLIAEHYGVSVDEIQKEIDGG